MGALPDADDQPGLRSGAGEPSRGLGGNAAGPAFGPVGPSNPFGHVGPSLLFGPVGVA
ncbi:hypothetical protein [Gordonia sp. VNK21]|uniref:hypothetical protein n=1 Tax=Gordonia sp. VNK21 TaxID=3382483 RepID=UPI0038D48376